jgi:hypothetical protein
MLDSCGALEDLEMGSPGGGSRCHDVSRVLLVSLARVQLRGAARAGVFFTSAPLIPPSCMGFSGTARLCLVQAHPLMPIA